MVGPSRGRTIKALREKLERLSGDAGAVDDRNRLKNYHSLVVLAQQMRPERLVKLPESELRPILHKIVGEEKVSLPVDVETALVDHKLNSLVLGGAVGPLSEASKPWSDNPSPFDPMHPMLSSLGIPMPNRLSKYKQCFWGRFMVPLLSTSDGQERRVRESCEAVLQTFANEDPLELDMAMATTMRDCVTSASAVKAILDLSVDPSHDAAIEKLRNRRGKTDRSIVTMVANALAASPQLADNLDLMGRGRVLVLEFGGRAVQHEQCLKADPEVSVSYATSLREMCADLGKIKASNGCELFEPFGTKVLDHVNALLTKAVAEVQAQRLPLTQELLGALDQCASEAVIAFPLDRELSDHQAQLASIITKESGQVRLDSLKGLLKKGLFFDMGEPSSEERMSVVASALKDCAGIDIPPEIAEIANKEVLLLAMSLAEAAGDERKHAGVVAAMNLWDLLLDRMHLVSAPFALLALAKSAVAVWGCVASIGGLSATMSLHDKQPEVQKLSVELRLGETAMQALGNVGNCELKTCLQTKWGEAMARGSDVVGRFANDFYAERRTALAQLLEKAEGYAKGYHLGDHWYDGVPGSTDKDWDTIIAKAKDTVFVMDTKALSDTLQDIDVAIDATSKAADLLVSGEAGQDDPIPSAKEAMKAMGVLLRQALLAWHLSKEVDRESLRRKVQGEIKALRAMGLKERDWLPPAMYRKAWDALTCAA